MTDPSNPATTPSQCHLLKLPGELRNRIYDYILIRRHFYTDEILDKPLVVPLVSPSWKRGASRISPGCKNDSWDLLLRKALGLTQTCRAIRQEFLPLHLNSIEVHIFRPEDVQQYILDFFLRSQDAYGTCALDEKYLGNSVEILPIIRALSKAPDLRLDLRLKFWYLKTRDQVNFDALVDVKENETWRKYVENNVTGIVYFTDRGSYKPMDNNQLFVNIRHAVGEPWMVDEKKENTEDEGNSAENNKSSKKPQCVRKWLDFVGLAHLDKTLVDVGIQVAPPDEDCEGPTNGTVDR